MWTAPAAKDSATVILLRDTDSGPQVFLQRRVGSMKFAAGMYVFPGGRVEASDADPQVPWAGDPQSEPFSLATDAAETASFRAVTVAATRETWEEAAVILGVYPDGAAISKTPSSPEADVVAWLRDVDGAVNGSGMVPWAHWVTPEIERHRFDTRFLAAAIPKGQSAQDLGVESDNSVWIDAEAALARAESGQMPMLPPTVDAIRRLVGHATVAGVLASADPRPTPLMPQAIQGESADIEWVIVNPYTGEQLQKW
jgi:8-oxo-dGTP pyrophosphatase MutT (NUDIX family)